MRVRNAVTGIANTAIKSSLAYKLQAAAFLKKSARRTCDQIVALFPNDVAVFRRGGKWRSRLRMHDGVIASVLFARSVHRSGSARMQIRDAAGAPG
jgi:hypothetical protein